MTAVQTSYSLSPATALAGMRARFRPGAFAATMIALATLTPGRIYFKGPASGGAAGEIGPIEPAADADAILATGGASTAGVQNISGGSLNGVIGVGEIYPPRSITLTLSNHADWDATNATVTGTDENGETITDTIAIPNGGNATVESAKKFRTVSNINIPAQSGTGGTFTAGVGTLLGAVDHLVAGLVELDVTRTSLTYADGDLVPVAREGEYWAVSETAVREGDPVWVRVVAGVGENLGALRATPDANDCVRIKNARFTSTNSAGLSKLELNLPAG